MKHIVLSNAAKILALAVIYFITGKFGLGIGVVSNFATLVWLPSGIALAWLYIFGRHLWPGVFLGAFFVNLMTGASFFSALGIAIGNTLEVVVGVYILQKLHDFQSSMERMRDVLSLTLFVGPVCAAVSATMGVTTLLLAKSITPTMFVPTWLTWFVGNEVSYVIIAPLLFVWSTPPTIKLTKERNSFERILLIILTAISSIFVFTTSPSGPPFSYLLFPPLIWAAIRFNPRVVITIIFSLSLLSLLTTWEGLGPFAKNNISESLLYLQCFMGVIGFTSLVFAAVVSERNRFEKRKDDFISMVSHELKTPVTSIKIYIDILTERMRKIDDEKSVQMLSNISKQIGKLKNIVSDLLDVSRIETERLQFEKETFAVNALIKEVIENLQPTTDKHTLVYEKPSKVMINADKFRIYQVLTNLLTNAIKYMPKKGKIITKVQKKQDKVIISVQDFGVGISKDQQKRIFDQFYQANEEHEKTFPGLGMGLYITKEIVKRHGGEIWVESKKGKGSTFYFTLPI